MSLLDICPFWWQHLSSNTTLNSASFPRYGALGLPVLHASTSIFAPNDKHWNLLYGQGPSFGAALRLGVKTNRRKAVAPLVIIRTYGPHSSRTDWRPVVSVFGQPEVVIICLSLQFSASRRDAMRSALSMAGSLGVSQDTARAAAPGWGSLARQRAARRTCRRTEPAADRLEDREDAAKVAWLAKQ